MRFDVSHELQLFAESVRAGLTWWEAPLEPVFGVWQDDRDDTLAARLTEPHLLARSPQRRERLVGRRQLRIADERGLDRVRRVLDLQHARREGAVGEVGPTPGSTCADRRRRGR